jgi:hypothetical protein
MEEVVLRTKAYGFIWDWDNMKVWWEDRGEVGHEVYELRWNDELQQLECKNEKEDETYWRSVNGYPDAIEFFKQRIVEKILLGDDSGSD